MLHVAIVRGKYLNNFELQNYNLNVKDISLTAISSQFPVDDSVPMPVIKLRSIADFSTRVSERFIKIITNRTIGDSQILFGLEKYANKFDIFHTADPHYYYSYQLARLRQQNRIKKLIVTSWETIPFNNESVAKKRFIKNFTNQNTDYYVCHTKKAVDCLITEGVNTDKIKLIRLGVDLDTFKPSEKKNKDFTLLFVGRLVEEKGILDLYEAFKNLKVKKVKNKKILLRIIGNGPCKANLLKAIKKDNLTEYVRIETKRYCEMPCVYQESDILVVPSKRSPTWEEQLGMVLMEGLSCGLPLVTYDTGAIAEVVGDAGIILKEYGAGELSTALNSLIHDEFKRDLLRMKARNTAVKNFDSKKCAKELVQLYRSV